MTDESRDRDRGSPVLAIDVGSSAAKAGVVEPDGTVVEVASSPIRTDTPLDRWVEQDAEQWWTAALAAVDALDPAQRARVAAVAVTGQMQDLVCVGADGAPLRPVILYSDTRAAELQDELVDELPGWGVAVGATPDATSVVGKWRWLVRHEPDTAAATMAVTFGAGAEVERRLTGRTLCDRTTAATTGVYDLATGSWWAPAVAADRMPVPELDDGGSRGLSVEMAERLGVPAGTVVVLAPGDAVATTLGIVGLQVDAPYASLGTSGWVAAAAPSRPHAPGLILLPGLGADHWVIAGPLLAGGVVADWAREQLLGGIDVAEFDRLASGTCAAGAGVLAFPHLDGIRVPTPDATASAALVGLTRRTDRRVIAAAVVEGVAHALRQIADLVGAPDRPLRVCGGVTDSDVWCTTIADVTGRVVERTDDTHASLRGAAIAAGLASITPPSTATFHPDPVRHALHRRLAATVDSLGDALRPISATLARVRAAPPGSP
jgi:xylulokinase